jgi:predicted GNAT family acetyltransferase
MTTEPTPVIDFDVVENTDDGRFELRRDGEIVSVADFTERGRLVMVPHVTTNPRHRDQGNAGRLMDGLLEILRESDRTIAPLCPFAARHIRDNPQHQDLLGTH